MLDSERISRLSKYFESLTEQSVKAGQIGEYKVAAFLVERGFSVFFDISSTSPVDIIANTGPFSLKIQVKARQSENDAFRLRKSALKRGKNNEEASVYDPDMIDLFALYALDVDTIAWLPSSNILDPLRAISLNTNPDKESKLESFYDYTDFEKQLLEVLIYKYGGRRVDSFLREMG